MFFELLIGLITVILVWDYLHKRKHIQNFKKYGIQTARQFPILGSAHVFAKETPETMIDMITRYNKKYGKTWYLYVLHECAVSTSDARVIEPIFSSQQLIMKSRLYELVQSWLGTGLLLSTGKKWHSRRKIITPTFHFKILEQFVEVFDKESGTMVEKLKDKADGKTIVNMFPIVCLTALDIIAETAMGVKVNAQLDPDFAYVKSVRAASEITATRVMNPSQRTDSWMRWTAPIEYRKLQKHFDVMHNFTDKVIVERRAALEKSIADGTHKVNEDSEVGSKKRMALLDVLLQSTIGGNPLTNEDIREEVDTFMFEGHDTTTSGISFTFYLLSRHPEVQEKVFQEIRAVIGDDKAKPVNMRDLQELKYLEWVIKESMRLFPPVPIVGRHVQEDTMINGVLYPAGTNVIINIYHALRDGDYFSEPEKFKPERFSDDAEYIDPFAYVPFSAGPRNCIGQKFAMLEMKSTVSKILRNFELLPLGEEVKPVMNLILRSSNGVNLGLKPRVYK